MSAARSHFASCSVLGRPLDAALDAASARVAEQLGGPADVAFLFVSMAYGAAAVSAAPARVRAALGGPRLLGCTAAGVCETAGESEAITGVALLAGRIRGAGFAAFHATRESFAEDARDAAAADVAEHVRAAVGLDAAATPTFVVLSDPFTLDPQQLLDRLGVGYPGAPVAGGLSSGAVRPGEHRLFLDDDAHASGAVGLAMLRCRARTVVSQGCRPVGRRVVVTKMKDGRVLQLSGEPALDVLEREVGRLPAPDRELAQRNLLVGRAAHEARDNFGRGDFLVRNLVGIVPAERSIVVGDRLRLGQTLQLQLRDRAAAEEDRDLLLDAARMSGPAGAALLFVCAGRGSNLFGRPDADVVAVKQRFGEIPLAGFACAGELGPVGGRNFVHGFTASLLLFGDGA